MGKKSEKMIECILDEFDFDRVEQAMRALRWGWVDHGKGPLPRLGPIYNYPTPSVKTLKATARSLLKEAWTNGKNEKIYYIGTGGFIAWRFGDVLKLVFAVDEACCAKSDIE